MPSKEELKFAIEAVEVVKEKIQSAKSIKEATEIINKDLETARESLKDMKIEANLNKDFYETVTIKIPAAVMNLLRASESVTGDTPVQFLEYEVVSAVRAQIEANGFLPTGKALADQYNLNPVFEAVLNDPIK